MQQLSAWQRVRTRTFLFGIVLKRRMTLGARAALIDGDRVFLIKHTYLPGWQFPGGGVEPGESAEESAAREVLEETGCRMVGRPQLFGFYYNVQATTVRDHLAFYVCRDYAQARPFTPNREIADARWFFRGALPEDTTPGTLRRMAEVFENEVPAARW